MSYNNELYIFSEVPGYDASKGERIAKAFQKLQAGVEHLEQVRISEKSTCSQKVQANKKPELTLKDVQSQILSTQIRYIIKIMREWKNNKQQTCEINEDASEVIEETFFPLSNNSQLEPEKIVSDQIKHQEIMQTEENVLEADCISEKQLKHNMNIDRISAESETSQWQNDSTNTPASISHRKQKSRIQPHYHLKPNDMPFILGISPSESQSKIATYQNIFALMKTHKKALCAPKLHTRRKTVSCSDVNRDYRTDGNETLILKLSEDLPNLKQKHEQMEVRFDKVLANQPQHEKVKTEKTQKKGNPFKSKIKPTHSGNSLASDECSGPVPEQKLSKKRLYERGYVSQKHSVPTIRMQTNNNPQLGRIKLMRFLKDFKTQLSEDDISWE